MEYWYYLLCVPLMKLLVSGCFGIQLRYLMMKIPEHAVPFSHTEVWWFLFTISTRPNCWLMIMLNYLTVSRIDCNLINRCKSFKINKVKRNCSVGSREVYFKYGWERNLCVDNVQKRFSEEGHQQYCLQKKTNSNHS